MAEPVSASIIIRTFNVGSFLDATLKATYTQTGAPFEVIVVDSGSTDETIRIVRRHGAAIAAHPRTTFSYGDALNAGIAHASGEFAVLLSADAQPAHSGWLRALLTPFADQRVAAIYGRQMARPHAHPLERRDYEYWFPDGPAPALTSRGTPFFSNANAAVRRALAMKRPFDPTLPADEDWEWAAWAVGEGHKIVYAPDAAVWHSHEYESLRAVYRRARRESLAAVRIGAAAPLPLGPRVRHLLRQWRDDTRYLVSIDRADAVPSGWIRRAAIEAGRHAGEWRAAADAH